MYATVCSDFNKQMAQLPLTLIQQQCSQILVAAMLWCSSSTISGSSSIPVGTAQTAAAAAAAAADAATSLCVLCSADTATTTTVYDTCLASLAAQYQLSAHHCLMAQCHCDYTYEDQ
jgi:Tfp pilus assembly protein PilW